MNKPSDASRTVWEQMYDYLKSKGYEVYSPGQHEGEALSKYLVIMDSGTISGTRMEQKIYSIMCYIPRNQYSQVEETVNKLKKDMVEMFPLLRPTGNETPVIFDDTVSGYMASIEYMNYRKIPIWSY